MVSWLLIPLIHLLSCSFQCSAIGGGGGGGGSGGFIFGGSGGAGWPGGWWQPPGLVLPASPAGSSVRVLRINADGHYDDIPPPTGPPQHGYAYVYGPGAGGLPGQPGLPGGSLQFHSTGNIGTRTYSNGKPGDIIYVIEDNRPGSIAARARLPGEGGIGGFAGSPGLPGVPGGVPFSTHTRSGILSSPYAPSYYPGQGGAGGIGGLPGAPGAPGRR